MSVEKIRACLRLASPDSGGTEAERRTALKAAEKLLEKLPAVARPPSEEDALRQQVRRLEQRIIDIRRDLDDAYRRLREAGHRPSSLPAATRASAYHPVKGDVVDLQPYPGLVRINAAGESTISFTNLIAEAVGLRGAGERVTRFAWRKACENATHFERRIR